MFHLHASRGKIALLVGVLPLFHDATSHFPSDELRRHGSLAYLAFASRSSPRAWIATTARLDVVGPTPTLAHPRSEGFRAREPSGWDTIGNTFASSRDVRATSLLVAHLTSSCHALFRTDRSEGTVDEWIGTSRPRKHNVASWVHNTRTKESREQDNCLRWRIERGVDMAAKTHGTDALSSVEHTALGMFAGVVEVTCTMPMVSIKNALQSNRSIPLSPRELYRGWLVNAIGIAPITGVSFGVNRLLQRTLAPGVEQSEMGLGLQMFCPTVAGVAAGLVCGPSELVMIQQQQRKQSLAAQAKQIYQVYGVLAFGRGLGPTFVREGLYSWGYLGLCPLVREQLASTPALKDYPTTAYIAGGMASGVVACAATHPFDTVKTRMQANMDKKAAPEYKSMPSTFMHVYREKGFFQGLYSGFLPRTGRLMVAVVILSGVKDKLVELVTNHRESAAKPTDM